MGRIVRKVHVRNCSSQYMLLASDNLKFMTFYRVCMLLVFKMSSIPIFLLI